MSWPVTDDLKEGTTNNCVYTITWLANMPTTNKAHTLDEGMHVYTYTYQPRWALCSGVAVHMYVSYTEAYNTTATHVHGLFGEIQSHLS